MFAVCNTAPRFLSLLLPVCVSTLRRFPGPSPGCSNHSVNVTRQRFFPLPWSKPDDDDDRAVRLWLLYKRRLCVCRYAASAVVCDPATEGGLLVNLKLTSALLEYPSPYSTMADRRFTPASVPFLLLRDLPLVTL